MLARSVLVEWLAPLLLLLAALVWVRLPVPAAWLRPLRRSVRRLAARRRLCIIVVAGTSLAINACYGLLVYKPTPYAKDEFAYLLAGDTFARGRLTNPTHPLSEHLVSDHIIHTPTYQAKYPPGQGLFLALGQVLCGEPIVGVWLSMALASAAIVWMLQAWLPPRWALLGGLLSVIHPRICIWWGQVYWGGAVAVLGGALLFGGIRRLLRGPRVGDAVLFACGLAVLANSRPYEGLIASLPCVAVLLYALVHNPQVRRSALRIAIPVLVVAMATGAAMAYYNYRVTGEALTMPYQVWIKQTYDADLSRTLFTWQSHRAVASRWETAMVVARYAVWKAGIFWSFYFGTLLTIPLLALRRVWRDRWMLFAIASFVLVWLVCTLQPTQPHAHYAAPVVAIFFLLLIRGLRHLRLWAPGGRPLGRFVAAGVPVVLLVSFLFGLADLARINAGRPWQTVRADIVTRLSQSDQRHLIVVRYGADHEPSHEWVYNGADIDDSQVVWARELEPAKNRRLLEYFKDRTVWLLEPDADPPRLVRFRNGPSAASNEVVRRQRSTYLRELRGRAEPVVQQNADQ